MDSLPLTEEERAALTPVEQASLVADEARTQMVEEDFPAERAALVPPAEEWIAGRLRSAAQCSFPPRRAFFARQAALATVQRWRYVPGKRAGVPEAMWFNVPIRFVLD